MSTSPLYALTKAVTSALKAGDGAWEDRVALNHVDTGWAYPYLVIMYHGGGERNTVRQRNGDADIVLVVKAVSDQLLEAAEASEAAAVLINDRGTQDVTTGALYGGTTWAILTSTREDFISYPEYKSETVALYHEGARYRFMMEAR